ncbi:MAG: FliM/FliN family flagellar motor switch protein [Phycisphaerales bacterium]|nr:FliM/FliN family flagellar motor switch protein [Phycisphaerales bacterium]
MAAVETASAPAARAAPSAPQESSGVAGAPRVAASAVPNGSPEAARIGRLLQIRVPVIARLAQTRMPLADVRRMANGSIVRLDKPVEEPLDLMINNHVVGTGTAVRVGEHFGLRIESVGDARTRLMSISQPGA